MGPGRGAPSKSDALENVFSRVTERVRIAPVRKHDRNFLSHLKLPG